MNEIVYSSVLLIIPIVLKVFKFIMYYAALAVLCMVLCSFMYDITF